VLGGLHRPLGKSVLSPPRAPPKTSSGTGHSIRSCCGPGCGHHTISNRRRRAARRRALGAARPGARASTPSVIGPPGAHRCLPHVDRWRRRHDAKQERSTVGTHEPVRRTPEDSCAVTHDRCLPPGVKCSARSLRQRRLPANQHRSDRAAFGDLEGGAGAAAPPNTPSVDHASSSCGRTDGRRRLSTGASWRGSATTGSPKHSTPYCGSAAAASPGGVAGCSAGRRKLSSFLHRLVMGVLRRIVASWCINHRADGGLELPPKVVHERQGRTPPSPLPGRVGAPV
jgi:hypothetical protein